MTTTTTSTSRSSSPQSIHTNYAEELQEFIAGLLLQPDHEPVASELEGVSIKNHHNSGLYVIRP